ncbi:MAG: branched-chain amino acid ABC transporter permease [Sciscionella sp.]
MTQDVDEQTSPAPRQRVKVAGLPRRLWIVAVSVALAAAVIGLAVPFLIHSSYFMGLLVQGALVSLLALGIGFLARHLGLISLGHSAFFGGAAYGVAMASTHWHWSPLAAAFFGFAAGCLLAVVIGALVVRASGMGFLMLTLALEQALAQITVQQSARPITGAYDGLQVTFDSGQGFLGLSVSDLLNPGLFWEVAWVALVVVALALWLVGRSGFGTILEGIRENEERMRFSGFGTLRPRLIAFVISGAAASLGGTLFALNAGYVSPELFGFVNAGNALIAAILGGLGSVGGPILGAMLFTYGQAKLNVGGNIDLYTGVALVVVLIFFRDGITGGVLAMARRLRRRGSKERS